MVYEKRYNLSIGLSVTSVSVTKIAVLAARDSLPDAKPKSNAVSISIVTRQSTPRDLIAPVFAKQQLRSQKLS